MQEKNAIKHSVSFSKLKDGKLRYTVTLTLPNDLAYNAAKLEEVFRQSDGDERLFAEFIISNRLPDTVFLFGEGEDGEGLRSEVEGAASKIAEEYALLLSFWASQDKYTRVNPNASYKSCMTYGEYESELVKAFKSAFKLDMPYGEIAKRLYLTDEYSYGDCSLGIGYKWDGVKLCGVPVQVEVTFDYNRPFDDEDNYLRIIVWGGYTTEDRHDRANELMNALDEAFGYPLFMNDVGEDSTLMFDTYYKISSKGDISGTICRFIARLTDAQCEPVTRELLNLCNIH